MRDKLPASECMFGYPAEQLREILGGRYAEFNRWMDGQTVGVCDGQTYDHEAKQYYQSNCGPHGIVTYPQDIERFLAGLPVVD